ncbi:glycoside hydrolase family 88 protein [Olivibacter sp. CPCC 100613]|uniref:glycoside hydrolase family 88/105 protein n=1 Tax=Olivibacter sp. CPCC 100613 TaxID=3079931 RepID=UPI002FF8B8DB
MKKIAAMLIAATCLSLAYAQKNVDLNQWPAEKSPIEIGRKIAWHFIETPHPNFGKSTPPKVITYPETCTWYGALAFAKESGDKKLSKALADRFEPLFSTEATMIPVPDHVDYAVFGSVPLELYRLTKQQRYYDLGIRIANKQWGPPEGPRVTSESHQYYHMGLTWQTRLWIDDMYMITVLQAQAYRVTKEEKYINQAAEEMVFYLDKLQKPNGLFYHAPDVPFFWGRGNGWMAAGMAELLRSLPKQNPNFKRIMKGYQLMMASLLKYQSTAGAWRQLIDDEASWPETSSTGMFTYAMITGIKKGWLDKRIYVPAVRKAWLTLITYLNDQHDIRNVCEGTNKKNDHQYYLDRKRITGDMHGQAPLLWCAAAFLREK